MEIATWNIAGIKARLPLLLDWLKDKQPDIACLQEIKTVAEAFPTQAFEELGYEPLVVGQKSFNGVTILTKKTPEETKTFFFGSEKDEQARFIEAVFNTDHGPLKLACLYAPNGNPVESAKYPYKLHWMEQLYHHAQAQLKEEIPYILAGDFNIIPQKDDAKNPEKWEGDALFLPQSRDLFFKLCHLGFTDAIRSVTMEPCYTFWDFQAGAWPKNNGMRIDHFLLSPQAADLLQKAYVEKAMRGAERPSDHVPVWIALKNNL